MAEGASPYADWSIRRADARSLFGQLEAANERTRRYDRFIRETIAVWDAKGPMIASDALRERFLAFVMIEASSPAKRPTC